MTPKPTGARASSPRSLRVLPASGAVMAAIAVALSAYVAHVVDPAAQARLQPAALFAFGHGIALAALGPLAVRWSARLALMGLLLGTLLFSGSLVEVLRRVIAAVEQRHEALAHDLVVVNDQEPQRSRRSLRLHVSHPPMRPLRHDGGR